MTKQSNYKPVPEVIQTTKEIKSLATLATLALYAAMSDTSKGTLCSTQFDLYLEKDDQADTRTYFIAAYNIARYYLDTEVPTKTLGQIRTHINNTLG